MQRQLLVAGFLMMMAFKISAGAVADDTNSTDRRIASCNHEKQQETAKKANYQKGRKPTAMNIVKPLSLKVHEK